jgi:carboxypeptidase PM20D1
MIRRVFLGLVGLVVVLLLVVMGRALMVGSSRQPEGAIPPVDHAAATRIAQRLGEAVRFQTVSIADSEKTNDALDAMYDWMRRTYPRVFDTLTAEMFGRSLALTWKGSDSSAAPLVLMAHMDVVPVEAGTESKWAHRPFSGDISDGFVWGRGTLDDKLNVVGELEAIEGLMTSGFTPRRTVILSFGHNEEVLGSGARAIAADFKARSIHPLMVVDEGGAVISGEVPGSERPVALIGISEKGYLSVELVVDGVGGHSSMPPMETATGIVAAAVAKLEQNQMPARLSTTRQTMDAIAPEIGLGARMLLANMWLVGPVVKSYLARSPSTNAAIRTTTATTMFTSGVKDNVLSARARAVVNFRLLPGDSIAGVLAHVRGVVNDPRVSIRPLSGGSEPSPVSDVQSPAYSLIARTIRETMPDVMVAPYVLMAATDSRHFANVSPNVFRFTPVRLDKEDLTRIHGTNERVGVDNMAELVAFYTKLVRNADGPQR